LSVHQVIGKFSNENSAISADLPKGINLDVSTWATRSCGSTIGLVVPSVVLCALHREAADHGRWISVAEAQTGGSIDIYLAPKDWRNAAAKQQAFLRKEDAETRRITYLYEDDKPQRYGQFNHQVFVPTPRPSDIESFSEDDSSDSAGSRISSRTSSPESLRHGALGGNKSKPRRASTARWTRPGQDTLSSDDESGSASTCSSDVDSESFASSDIPTKLADQLRQFRAIRQSMLESTELPHEDLSAPDKGLPPTGLRSGTVVKVSLLPVGLALQPIALNACTNLISSLRDYVSNYPVIWLISVSAA
jgi:hypothetical protein